ncbi:MAG: hypothetical protein HQ500_00550 [Flavobacteriales bacterium]|nr:hypothetical protein [Flavobacteriales bacterium]
MRGIITIILALFALQWSACSRCRDGCMNGTCIKKACACDLWYEGDRCDRSSLTSYVGYYRGTATNDRGTVRIGFHLFIGESPDQMLADSLGLFFDFDNQSRFAIPEQTYAGAGYAGEGEMLVELISIRLDPVSDAPQGSTLIQASKSDI